MRFRVIVLLLLCTVSSLAAEETFLYRYWMVPAEKIGEAPWGDERYYPTRLERLRQWFNSLERSSPENLAQIKEIQLEASFFDGALSEGEGRICFSEKSAEVCELTPCSLPLSQLRWEDGSEINAGSDGIHPVTLRGIIAGKNLLFSWSLSPESDDNEKTLFRFELPCVPAVSLRLHLPKNLVPSVDAGFVTHLDEDGLWLIEPGPVGNFALILTSQNQPKKTAVPATVSEQIACGVALEGIEIVYTARFANADQLPDKLELKLDEPFLPEQIEWGSGGVAETAWEKDSETQTVIVRTPRFGADEVPSLTLTAFAPFTPESTLTLPPVHCVSGVWQETELAVNFVSPAAPKNFAFTDAGQYGSGGQFHLLKKTGSIGISLTCLDENLLFESATRIAGGSGNLRFETDLFVRTDVPGIRRLTVPVKPQWVPESVTVGTTPVPFRLETEGNSAFLTLALENPVPTEQPLNVRIIGRLNLTDPAPHLADYVPLTIQSPATGVHLVAFAFESSSKISLIDKDGQPQDVPDVPEETVRRLFGAIPGGTVFSLQQSLPDLCVRVENAPPEYTAELTGRVSVYADSIREEWNIRCVPSGTSRLDRILITFNQNDMESWLVSTTQLGDDETKLEMNPVSDEEKSLYHLHDGQMIGEILLTPPRSAPFTVQLKRKRSPNLSSDVDVPLPSLCAVSKQTGRVDLLTPDFSPVRFEAHSMTPVTSPPAEKGNVVSALASYAFNPGEQVDFQLKVRSGGESRRNGWCRYLRLESYYTPVGTVRTSVHCQIENTGLPVLRIGFPESIDLVNAGSVRSGKMPIPYRFTAEERYLEIPLSLKQRDLVVSFEFESRIPRFGFFARLPRQVPQLNMPVLSGDWTANFSNGYRINDSRNSGLTRIPLDAPRREYRLISLSCLRILQVSIFLFTVLFGLQFHVLRTFLFGLTMGILWHLTRNELISGICQGLFAGCITVSIFNFFYRRPVAEPANDLSEDSLAQPVPRDVAAAILFLIFCASPVRAEESYSIFVPQRNNQPVEDEPAWISEELQSRLSEWERENTEPENAAQFQSALYEGQLKYNRETGQYSFQRLTVKYNIVSTGTDSRLDLPLMPIFREGGILIDGVAGSVSLLQNDQRTRLELHGLAEGIHTLELTLLPDPFDENSHGGLTLALPAVPDSKLLLRVPVDVLSPRLIGAMGQVSSSPGILSADLGQTSSITFLPPEKAAARGEVSIESEQEFRLSFAEEQIVLHGQFRLHVGGRCAEVTFLVDPRYRLLRCTSPDADLIPMPVLEPADRIPIVLRQNVTGTLTLYADFAPRDFSGIGELPLPVIRIAEASTVSSRLLMPEGYYPSEYNLTAPETLKETILVTPPAFESKMTETASYRFDIYDTAISYRAELETAGELWQLSVRTPEKYRIESFEVTDTRNEAVPFRKSEDSKLIHFFFDKALCGSYHVDLRLRAETTDEFPLTGILDIPASDAELSIECAEPLYYEFTPPGEWMGLPSARGEKRWSLPAAAGSLVPHAISVMPNRPKADLTAKLFFYPLAESPDHFWELRAEYQMRVRSGEYRYLEFEIDESFRADSIRIEPLQSESGQTVFPAFKTGFRRGPDGGRRLILTPEEPIRGEFGFVLLASVQSSSVRFPKIEFLAESERDLQVWLPQTDGKQVLVWDTENLSLSSADQRGLDPNKRVSALQLPATNYLPRGVSEASQPKFDMFKTYRPDRPGSFSASLPAEDTPLHVDRTGIDYYLRGDGSYWGRAVYNLHLGTHTMCDIRVPAGQEILSAEAIGVPLPLQPGPEEKTIRLQFTPESPIIRLTLTFTALPGERRSLRIKRNLYNVDVLTAPAPVGAEPSPGLWTVHFEKDTCDLPYYVSQGSSLSDIKAIGKSFPGKHPGVSLENLPHWKRPVSSAQSLPLCARLNIDRLSYLLDLIGAVDSKLTLSPGGLACWLDAWTPLYNQSRDYFTGHSHIQFSQAQLGALYLDSSKNAGSVSAFLTAGTDEFAELSKRWNELSQRLGLAGDSEKTVPQPLSVLSEGVSAPMNDAGSQSIVPDDLVLFGAVDKVTDILLAAPVPAAVSWEMMRMLVSCFFVLAALAIVTGGVLPRLRARFAEKAPKNVRAEKIEGVDPAAQTADKKVSSAEGNLVAFGGEQGNGGKSSEENGQCCLSAGNQDIGGGELTQAEVSLAEEPSSPVSGSENGESEKNVAAEVHLSVETQKGIGEDADETAATNGGNTDASDGESSSAAEKA